MEKAFKRKHVCPVFITQYNICVLLFSMYQARVARDILFSYRTLFLERTYTDGTTDTSVLSRQTNSNPLIWHHNNLLLFLRFNRLIRVHLPAIKQMSIVGYSTSLALLLGAFTLLASLK